MEPRPDTPPTDPTDAEREAAAVRLADAAGDGRLTLGERSPEVPSRDLHHPHGRRPDEK